MIGEFTLNDSDSFRRIIEEYQRRSEAQLDALVPWIKLFRIVVWFVLVLWILLTIDSQKWYEYLAYGGIAFVVANGLAGIVAYQAGKYLGKKAARDAIGVIAALLQQDD